MSGPEFADVNGTARVIDGDTLSIDGRVVRLFRTDAPEMAQRCDGPKRLRKCGVVAADALAERSAEGVVTCEVEGMDLSARMLSEG